MIVNSQQKLEFYFTFLMCLAELKNVSVMILQLFIVKNDCMCV